jgi:hypothetical protein
LGDELMVVDHQQRSVVSLVAAVAAILLVLVSPVALDLHWVARFTFIFGLLVFLWIVWRFEGRRLLKLRRPIGSGLLLIGILAVSSAFPHGLGKFLPDDLGLLLLLVGPLAFVAGAVWAAYGFIRNRSLQYCLEGTACYFLLLVNLGFIARL